MGLITNLTPINLNEEKAKFFTDHKYNPQFIYKTETSKEKLIKYGIPKLAYTALAQEILDKTYFNRNESDLFMMKGPKLTQKYVEKTVQTFLHMHNLQKKYKTIWSSSFIARTTIHDNTINLRLPVDFRKEDLLGMLYHEIGTHAIRRINYEKQPWFRKKKKYGFSPYLKTEEGLATLHSLIPHSHKSAFISAIRYVAISTAQKSSFAKTWQSIGKYVQDPDRRWSITVRQKRGLTDTSKPGGFSKDLVYFEGSVDIYNYLEDHNFDISDLYFGKLALKDVKKAVEMNPDFVPELPSFFSVEREKYIQGLVSINDYNGFSQLKK